LPGRQEIGRRDPDDAGTDNNDFDIVRLHFRLSDAVTAAPPPQSAHGVGLYKIH
jgi:hypothetical protein